MKRNLIVFAVFMIFTGIYIATVAPAYNSDDSPETTMAFHTLGIQHPPGYPLNTLAGKIFTFLPLGSYMFRANLMAVFFNLLAGFFIFLAVRELAASKEEGYAPDAAGLAAAALFLFSASAWLQSTSAKGSIYALNAFMTAACLWAMLRVKLGAKFLYLFCFLYGLSLGNHWTSMLVIAPGIAFYLFTQRRHLTPARVLIGAGLAFLGVAVYIYVFLRSGTHPVYAWGDTKTLKDLLWLISRAQYAAAEQKHTIADSARLFFYYAKNLALKEYPLLLSLLFIPGAYMLFKRKKNEAAALVISLVFLVFSVVSVATPPKNTEWLIKPYLVSANIFIGILAALCMYYFIFQSMKSISLKLIFGGAALLAVTAVVFVNNPRYDRYYIGYDYSKNLTMTAGKNSIVFTEGDMNIGAILYETLVKKEKYVALIPVVLQYEWYRRQVASNYPGMFNLPGNAPDMKTYLREIIAANRDKNVFYSNVYTTQWLEGLTYYPEGILYRVRETSVTRPVSDLPLRLYSYRGIVGPRTGYDEFTQRLVFDNYAGAFNSFAETLRNAGQLKNAVKFYRYGLLFAKNSGALVNMGLTYYYLNDMDGAGWAWQQASDLEPKNPLPYTNLAFVYMSKKDFKGAARQIDTALKMDPNYPPALKVKEDLKKLGAY